ncbi:ABC transporter permease [Shimazuella alba]|uniref:ABC transporter permease subunit n=1 Tax=Shimazuella alba TaxID=2690964 RepID=A0A6I4VUL2_9BACL|nr:ABC transporter permease [Shimazuella alba]MXQ53486.1 ABC transporter permease subunit [Shimazuella alba]
MDYIKIFATRGSDLWSAMIEHLIISGTALILGIIVAVPLGIYLVKTKNTWLRSIAFSITNIFQTIPSLALLAILIPLIGIGKFPAIIALFLYSLLPILRNTYSGFKSIDESIIEAARGMGYDGKQRLFRIELPLAIPYLMSGIRLTTIYIISWATLATLIGAGGLGELIYGGLSVYDKPLIFASSITTMILAIVIDFLLGALEKFLTKQTTSREQSA